MSSVLRGIPLDGWQLRPTSTPGTPVETLKAALGSRLYYTIANEHIATVEELAAVPTGGWLGVRNVGQKTIQRIRTVVAEAEVNAIEVPARLQRPLDEQQARELLALMAVLVEYARADGDAQIGDRASAFITSLRQP